MTNREKKVDTFNQELLLGMKDIFSDIQKGSKQLSKPPLYVLKKCSDTAIFFYDHTRSIGEWVYKRVKGEEPLIEKEQSKKNLETYVKSVQNRIPDLVPHTPTKKKLEQQLLRHGSFYVPPQEIEQLPATFLRHLAAQYDDKGIIPNREETLPEFAFRANTLLYLHHTHRKYLIRPEINIEKDGWDISLTPLGDDNIISRQDIAEANQKIMYDMDLSWVTGYIGEKNGLLSSAYGMCLTLPKYNGFTFLMVREQFKTREKYLAVLAHEMTHMGTVYLDSRRDFLETKAYAVGSAAFGEHTIAINKQPHLITRAVLFGIETFFRIPIPQTLKQIGPKMLSAVRIAENRGLYNRVSKRLHHTYGTQKGNYILGRLTADEIEAMGYTNNLPKLIDQQTNLKWEIMKQKISKSPCVLPHPKGCGLSGLLDVQDANSTLKCGVFAMHLGINKLH